MCYDVSRLDSFQNIKDVYYQQLDYHCDIDYTALLVGVKVNDSDVRQVSQRVAESQS